MQLCILADAADVDRAKQLDEELPFMTVEDLKKLNKVSWVEQDLAASANIRRTRSSSRSLLRSMTLSSLLRL